MEMEVATLYCFVDGNNIQTGAIAGDSEANFFPNFKDGNFVASPSVHIATLGSFGIAKPIYSMPKVSSYYSLSVTSLGFLYICIRTVECRCMQLLIYHYRHSLLKC